MKKRFLYLLIGLNLLLVSSISMSLAWFMGAVDLVIDDIELVVDVDADFKISTEDDFKYAKDSLTETDFGKVENLIPVSTMCYSEWVDKAEYKNPRFYEQYKRGTKKEPPKIVASKGFFSKTFYLFSDKHMLVTFDSKNTIIKPNTTLNAIKASEKAADKALKTYRAIADALIAQEGITDQDRAAQIYNSVKNEQTEYYYNKYLTELNAIENSLRISILDYQNLGGSIWDVQNTNHVVEKKKISNYVIIDPKKTSDPVVFGGRLATSITKDYYDFYVDRVDGEYYETVFGEIKYKDHDIDYLPVTPVDIPVVGAPSCFNAATRNGVHPLDLDKLPNNIEFFTEQSISLEEADVSTHPNDEQSGYLVELFPGVPHALTLSIYLEGWDLDSIDSCQEAAFDMSIKFKLYRQGDFL